MVLIGIVCANLRWQSEDECHILKGDFGLFMFHFQMQCKDAVVPTAKILGVLFVLHYVCITCSNRCSYTVFENQVFIFCSSETQCTIDVIVGGHFKFCNFQMFIFRFSQIEGGHFFIKTSRKEATPGKRVSVSVHIKLPSQSLSMGGSEAIALAMAIADGTYLAQGTAPRPKNTQF